MSLTRRALEIDQIIRQSEVFPRIRDAEKAMMEDETKFRKRREKKKKRREKLAQQQRTGTKINPIESNNFLPPIKTDTEERIPQLDYFTGHVLNKDPACSQYMPFNEVFFPKLFNLPPDTNNSHSIDLVWMLGFQHDAAHVSEVQKVKKEFKS